MSLLETLGGIGSAALATTGPVGVAVGAALNAFLKDDDAVKDTDTLDVVQAKFDNLTPEQQQKVLETLIQYQQTKVVSDNETTVEKIRVMEGSDQQIKVRPKIAMMMAWLITLITVGLTIIMGISSYKTGTMPSWELIGVILFLPTWVIQKYFHAESTNMVNRANMINGKEVSMPQGAFGAIAGKLMK